MVPRKRWFLKYRTCLSLRSEEKEEVASHVDSCRDKDVYDASHRFVKMKEVELGNGLVRVYESCLGCGASNSFTKHLAGRR